MTSKAETAVSQSLRAILAPLTTGASIEHAESLLAFQTALEFFLLAELEWHDEAFDAFRFAVARKLAHDEAEFIGLALFISDQVWTPIHLRLRLSPDADEVVVLDCRVGEPGDGKFGLVRIPYDSSRVTKYLFHLPQRIESIQWVYRAARG